MSASANLRLSLLSLTLAMAAQAVVPSKPAAQAAPAAAVLVSLEVSIQNSSNQTWTFQEVHENGSLGHAVILSPGVTFSPDNSNPQTFSYILRDHRGHETGARVRVTRVPGQLRAAMVDLLPGNGHGGDLAEIARVSHDRVQILADQFDSPDSGDSMQIQ